MNSEHLHPEGRPFTKDEFVEKIKNDKNFANRFGNLGRIYGKQWRNWETYEFSIDNDFGNNEFGGGWNVKQIDQIANLIKDLKTNPDSRRLMVNSWNCSELDQMVLPPCHYGFQVYTRELSYEERLKLVKNNVMSFEDLSTATYAEFFERNNIPTRAISLMWNQRSVDTFLGLPFNIASYGLLLEIIAEIVNMVPDELIGNLGDTHLYLNHIEQAKEQIGIELSLIERVNYGVDVLGYEGLLDYGHSQNEDELITELCDEYGVPKRTREPFPLPKLVFNPIFLANLEHKGFDAAINDHVNFQIENYQSHPHIPAPLSN